MQCFNDDDNQQWSMNFIKDFFVIYFIYSIKLLRKAKKFYSVFFALFKIKYKFSLKKNSSSSSLPVKLCILWFFMLLFIFSSFVCFMTQTWDIFSLLLLLLHGALHNLFYSSLIDFFIFCFINHRMEQQKKPQATAIFIRTLIHWIIYILL